MTIWSMKAKDEVTTHITKSVLSTVLLLQRTCSNIAGMQTGPIVHNNCTHKTVAHFCFYTLIPQLTTPCLFYNSTRLYRVSGLPL